MSDVGAGARLWNRPPSVKNLAWFNPHPEQRRMPPLWWYITVTIQVRHPSPHLVTMQ